jgi:hypothetical protein
MPYGVRSNRPWAAVIASEPFRVATAADKLELGRIPLEVRVVVVALVEQVTADGGAGADLFAGDVTTASFPVSHLYMIRA